MGRLACRQRRTLIPHFRNKQLQATHLVRVHVNSEIGANGAAHRDRDVHMLLCHGIGFVEVVFSLLTYPVFQNWYYYAFWKGEGGFNDWQQSKISYLRTGTCSRENNNHQRLFLPTAGSKKCCGKIFFLAKGWAATKNNLMWRFALVDMYAYSGIETIILVFRPRFLWNTIWNAGFLTYSFVRILVSTFCVLNKRNTFKFMMAILL